MPALWPAAPRAATMGACGWPRVSPPGARARGCCPDRRRVGVRPDRRSEGRYRVRRVVAVPVRPCGGARAGGRRCADCGPAACNPIGWILVFGALSLAAVLGAQPYAWAALEADPGSLPGGSWAALVSSLWPVFFAWPLAIAFVFPDGRLPSRRWRPYALFAAVSMTSPRGVAGALGEARKPVRGRGESVPGPVARCARVSTRSTVAGGLREPLRRRGCGAEPLPAARRGSSDFRCSGSPGPRC